MTDTTPSALEAIRERDALRWDGSCWQDRRALLKLVDELRGEVESERALRDIMVRRADRVSLFLDAFAKLMGAGYSVMVSDDQVPESGIFTITAKAKHVREFNAAMRCALDADKPENELGMWELRAHVDQLREALRNLSRVPAVLQALGTNHVGACNCPLCVAQRFTGAQP